MPTITIQIEVPEGSTVTTDPPDDALTPEAGTVTSKAIPGGVEKYFRMYLSDNGRAVFRAAAAVERESGQGYTFDDIAARLSRTHSSTLSLHRTTGRSARKWRDDTGTEAPIRLEWIDYEWDESQEGMRTTYRLPDGLADQIAAL